MAATMMRGIRKYGPPIFWYTDNGKPQKKAAKGAQPGYLVEFPLAPPNWRKSEIESIEATWSSALRRYRYSALLAVYLVGQNAKRGFSEPFTNALINAGRRIHLDLHSPVPTRRQRV